MLPSAPRPASMQGRTAGETSRQVARGNLPFVLIAALLSIVLSHVPVAGALVFPFRLMATFVHESSHALVALQTGGQVVAMVINPDLSGETLVDTSGLAGLLVASAGYLGTALAGALLLLVPVRRARATLWTLAVLAVLAVVAFHTSLYTALWGGIFAALCGLTAARASMRLAALLQSFIAVQLGLNALDALQVLGLYTVSGGGATDATMAARIALLPPLFWTVLWTVLAVAMLGGALWRVAAPLPLPRLPRAAGTVPARPGD